MGVNRGEECVPEFWLEERGCAASCEDGAELWGGAGLLGDGVGLAGEVFDELVGEGGLAVVAVDDGVEIAVVAFVVAEGDMDVEAVDGGV